MKAYKSIASFPAKRTLFYMSMAILALAALSPMTAAASKETTSKVGAIRPFHVHIPQEALDDLRHRLAATRWPDQETVSDGSQGVPLATLKELAHYWQTDYDWRKVEARLNALPQFVTEIDGVDIHFIHVKSRHPNALP